ncbi:MULTISPECIES: hypothetical protein [unclassified Arenibacter]|uniref:hypothetical protein n=1 Tax=unclassified Arenibacter TaxID=2615047 RepID=UPI0015F2AB09|nr:MULTISPECIES: hypothetical protein [unclassified Arenibacter]
MEYFIVYSCLPAGRFLLEEGILIPIAIGIIAIATDRRIADVWREKTGPSVKKISGRHF